MSFAHTPYDGSRRPFTIGVEPLDPEDWIAPDGFLARDLAQKDQLLTTKRDIVLRSGGGDTLAAQAEVLAMLVAHLPKRFPHLYRLEGDEAHIVPVGRSVRLSSIDAPLVTAARLVQEDLCLMRRAENGWRLAAAVVCFPSSWSLAEKFEQDLAAIHAPVPGFKGRMEMLVTRIFDNLRVGAPVKRTNWSIYNGAELHRPPEEVSAAHFTSVEDALARAHIRVEPQTLTKLPETGDVLFTIRVRSDPMADLKTHPRGRELALGLRAQLLALDESQADYKGLTPAREMLARALERIAEGA